MCLLQSRKLTRGDIIHFEFIVYMYKSFKTFEQHPHANRQTKEANVFLQLSEHVYLWRNAGPATPSIDQSQSLSFLGGCRILKLSDLVRSL